MIHYYIFFYQAKALKYEQALGKIDEAFDSISDYKREVSELTPKHKAATEHVRALVENVEAQKQDYIKVYDMTGTCIPKSEAWISLSS